MKNSPQPDIQSIYTEMMKWKQPSNTLDIKASKNLYKKEVRQNLFQILLNLELVIPKRLKLKHKELWILKVIKEIFLIILLKKVTLSL